MSNYTSPINIISSALRIEIENETLKAIKDVGIDVDKDELIKALKYDRNQYEKGFSDATPKWIPVSERLPDKEYDTVLVFLESNIYDIAIWHSEYGFRPWYAGCFEEATPEWESKVLAWMPLPEPYKED